jgi:hypothetical protein
MTSSILESVRKRVSSATSTGCRTVLQTIGKRLIEQAIRLIEKRPSRARNHHE